MSCRHQHSAIVDIILQSAQIHSDSSAASVALKKTSLHFQHMRCQPACRKAVCGRCWAGLIANNPSHIPSPLAAVGRLCLTCVTFWMNRHDLVAEADSAVALSHVRVAPGGAVGNRENADSPTFPLLLSVTGQDTVSPPAQRNHQFAQKQAVAGERAYSCHGLLS